MRCWTGKCAAMFEGCCRWTRRYARAASRAARPRPDDATSRTKLLGSSAAPIDVCGSTATAYRRSLYRQTPRCTPRLDVAPPIWITRIVRLLPKPPLPALAVGYLRRGEWSRIFGSESVLLTCRDDSMRLWLTPTVIAGGGCRPDEIGCTASDMGGLSGGWEKWTWSSWITGPVGAAMIERLDIAEDQQHLDIVGVG